VEKVACVCHVVECWALVVCYIVYIRDGGWCFTKVCSTGVVGLFVVMGR
jgi:hypothetical protein